MFVKRLFTVLFLMAVLCACGNPRQFEKSIDCGFFTIRYPDKFIASSDGQKIMLTGQFGVTVESRQYQGFSEKEIESITKEVKAQLGGEPKMSTLRFSRVDAKRLSYETEGGSKIAYIVWSDGWVGTVISNGKLTNDQADTMESMILSITLNDDTKAGTQGRYDSKLFSIDIPAGWTGKVINHTTLELSYDDLSKGVGKLTVYAVEQPGYADSEAWSKDFAKEMGWNVKLARMPIGNAIFTTFKNTDGNLVTRVCCAIRSKKMVVISYTASSPEIEKTALAIAKGLVFK